MLRTFVVTLFSYRHTNFRGSGCSVFFLLCIRFITICSPHPCYSCNGGVCSSCYCCSVFNEMPPWMYIWWIIIATFCVNTQASISLKLVTFSLFENRLHGRFCLSSSCRLLGSFRCFTSWIPWTNFLCNSSSLVRKDRIRISNYVAVHLSPYPHQ